MAVGENHHEDALHDPVGWDSAIPGTVLVRVIGFLITVILVFLSRDECQILLAPFCPRRARGIWLYYFAVGALPHENLPLSHSLNALCVKHFLPVQQGHNVANLPSPKRQEANTMRSQRQISREATRGVSAASAGVFRAGLVQGE